MAYTHYTSTEIAQALGITARTVSSRIRWGHWRQGIEWQFAKEGGRAKFFDEEACRRREAKLNIRPGRRIKSGV